MRGKVNYGISGNYVINGNRKNAVISGDDINKGDFVYSHTENGNVFKIEKTPQSGGRIHGGAFKINDIETLVLCNGKYHIFNNDTKEILASGGTYTAADAWVRLDDTHFGGIYTSPSGDNSRVTMYIYTYDSLSKSIKLDTTLNLTSIVGDHCIITSAYAKNGTLRAVFTGYYLTASSGVNSVAIVSEVFKLVFKDGHFSESEKLYSSRCLLNEVSMTGYSNMDTGTIAHTIYFNNSAYGTAYDRANGLIKRSKIFVSSGNTVNVDKNETNNCILLPVFASNEKFIVWKINASGVLTSYDVTNNKASDLRPSHSIAINTLDSISAPIDSYPSTVNVTTLIEGELYAVNYLATNGNVYRCLIGSDFISEEQLFEGSVRTVAGYDMVDEFNHNFVYFSQEAKEKLSDASYSPMARLQMIAGNKIVDEKPKDYYVSQAKNAQYINGVANESGSDGDTIQVITSDFVD